MPFPRPLVAFSLAAALAAPALAQQKNEISITRQPGILYMATHVMEKQHLIEKHAAALGLPDFKVNWMTFSGGGAQTDALLSGGVDVVNTGVGNLLLLWDRTRGGVKGIISTSAQPVVLISRDPKIKTIKDFGPADKIAVPTVKVSTQAILLQMAAAQTFGPDQWSKLDGNTVQLGHPDAAVALANPQHEVASHFSAPPFYAYELKNIKGTHVVLQSPDIIGGPLSQGQFFTTTKFADANPKAIEAIKAATLEAIELIRKDTPAAVEAYREISKDKTPAADILEALKAPGMMDYIPQPQGTMKFAAHLYKVGTLKTMPKAWSDYYLPSSKNLDGN